jgi:hypothetical protein
MDHRCPSCEFATDASHHPFSQGRRSNRADAEDTQGVPMVLRFIVAAEAYETEPIDRLVAR